MQLEKNNTKYSFGNGLVRRDFLKLSGLLSAGIAISGPAWSMLNADASAKRDIALSYLSLTPFILMSKASKLVRGTAHLSSDIHLALDQDISQLAPGNSYYMGMNLPFDTKELVKGLDPLMKKGTENALAYKDTQQLAIITGALTYRAINNELKKGSVGEPKGISSQEIQLYQDAELLRDFYSKGKKSSDTEALSNLFKEMIPRTLIRFHTIMPDERMGSDWVHIMQDWRKQTDNYYDNLAKAVLEPNRQQQEKIVLQSNFYDKSESVIVDTSTFNRLSAAYGDDSTVLLDTSSGITDEKIRSKQAEGKSVVARAILAGYLAILSIDDFWSGKSSSEKLIERLNA